MESEPASAAPPWPPTDLRNPHALADKALRVRRMFAAIAKSYDLNNHIHSLGLDWHWRRVAVKLARINPTDVVADIACGTGDLTLAMARAGPRRVIGLDFCRPMLELAVAKLNRRTQRRNRAPSSPAADAAGQSRPRNGRVVFYQADALRLPLPDQSVDVVCIAFGIRNVAEWGRAIDEFYRVLKPAGRLLILEFSLPQALWLRHLYNFYFRRVLPRTASLISGDRTGAYQYLPASVNTFISGEELSQRMQAAGFQKVFRRSLTGGICVCYRGVRVA